MGEEIEYKGIVLSLSCKNDEGLALVFLNLLPFHHLLPHSFQCMATCIITAATPSLLPLCHLSSQILFTEDFSIDSLCSFHY